MSDITTHRETFRNVLKNNKECIPFYKNLDNKQRKLIILKLSGYNNKEISTLLERKEKTIQDYYNKIWNKIFKRVVKYHKMTESNKLLLIHIFYTNYIQKQKAG